MSEQGADFYRTMFEHALGQRDAAREQRDALLAAIRAHRDVRGDDRCYQDDAALYAILPEGDTRPAVETAVTLENCQRYIACRQQGRKYISPQRRVEGLERQCATVLSAVTQLLHAWRACQTLRLLDAGHFDTLDDACARLHNAVVQSGLATPTALKEPERCP